MDVTAGSSGLEAVYQQIGRQFGCKALAAVEELRGQVDAATVAVPTIHHLSVAAALMAAGIDVLIEKPLASTIDEADELVRLAHADELHVAES